MHIELSTIITRNQIAQIALCIMRIVSVHKLPRAFVGIALGAYRIELGCGINLNQLDPTQP